MKLNLHKLLLLFHLLINICVYQKIKVNKTKKTAFLGQNSAGLLGSVLRNYLLN